MTRIFLLAAGLGAMAPQAAMAVERVAVGASFNRIYEQDANGHWHGLGVDVLRLLAARAGDTVRFQLYPWPRAQAMVERGQADILVGPYRSPQRLKRFAYLEQPFYRDRLVFYARRASDVSWQGDYASLAGWRVLAVRGWHYGEPFDLARPKLDLSEVTQVDNGLQMLAHGRVDLLASNVRNSAVPIEALHLRDALVEMCPDIGRLDGYLAFPRDARFTAVRQRYDALFSQMVRSGELQKLGHKNGVLVPGADGDGRAATTLAAADCRPVSAPARVQK
ncbi:MAG: transporter substrate-binding domain-containing protein [Duganella sp.]